MKVEIVIDQLRVAGVRGSRRQIREALEREIAQRIRETLVEGGAPAVQHLQLPEASISISPGLDAQAVACETGRHLSGRLAGNQGRHATTRETSP